MESVVTLQELARRQEQQEKAERLAKVKALTDEGLRMKAQQKRGTAKKRGGRVKSYFSPY